MEKTIVVLGLGNLLARDEGFGIHALHQLQAVINREAVVEFDGSLPNLASVPYERWMGDSPSDEGHGIQFIDGGVLGLNLLPK